MNKKGQPLVSVIMNCNNGDEDWAAMDTLSDKQYLEKLWNESTTPRKGW